MSNDAENLAIIFDLDGTLVDSYGAITESLNFARKEHGHPPLTMQTVRTAVGHGLEELIRTWVGEEVIESGVQAFRQRYAEVFASGTFALPGVTATLEQLHRCRHPMAIASNKPARFTRQIIDQFGWSELFVTVEGPDTVGATKPDPPMLRRCLALLGGTTESTLYIGDMALDVESARRAGLPCILVATGSADRQALDLTGETVMGEMSELPRVIDQRSWKRDRP